MRDVDPRALLRSFTDISGSYENIGLEISVNGVRVKRNAYEFVARTYHAHPYFELFYVKTEGLHFVARDFATLHLSKGDVLVIPPFCDHYTYLDPVPEEAIEDCFFVACFAFYDNHLNTSHDLYRALSARLSREAPTLISRGEYDTEGLEEALTEFENDVASGHKRTALLDFCKLLELLAKGEKEEKHPLSRSEIIAKIDNIISCYYMYDIKLIDVAECFFVSEHSLNRLIYEYYHDTFHSLLTKRRMRIAATFLKNTDETVAKIADKAGYPSLSNFYTAFKKHYGMLPADYRRENRVADDEHP